MTKIFEMPIASVERGFCEVLGTFNAIEEFGDQGTRLTTLRDFAIEDAIIDA